MVHTNLAKSKNAFEHVLARFSKKHFARCTWPYHCFLWKHFVMCMRLRFNSCYLLHYYWAKVLLQKAALLHWSVPSLIVLGLGTGRPGNFTRNLHRVSEHNFLLFIYVLWIYTRSHSENSCLRMSQIAIIRITTLTALTYNSNHNQ